MSKKKITSFFSEDIEKRVSIFTTLLVIAMFVTVAIYIYAGKQQNLPTRNVGSMHVRKNLQVDGQTFQKTDVKHLVDGDRIGLEKIIVFDPTGASESILLPSSSTLDNLKELTAGYSVNFYVMNISATQTFTVTTDDSRIVFKNTSQTIGTKTSREVIIKRDSDGDYTVFMI